MSPDGFPRNAWTDILGTGGRFTPEHLDTLTGIGTSPHESSPEAIYKAAIVRIWRTTSATTSLSQASKTTFSISPLSRPSNRDREASSERLITWLGGTYPRSQRKIQRRTRSWIKFKFTNSDDFIVVEVHKGERLVEELWRCCAPTMTGVAYAGGWDGS